MIAEELGVCLRGDPVGGSNGRYAGSGIDRSGEPPGDGPKVTSSGLIEVALPTARVPPGSLR